MLLQTRAKYYAQKMKHFSNSNLLEKQTEDNCKNESKSDRLHQENCFKVPIEIKSACHHKI